SRENGEDIEARFLEKSPNVVVADVKDAEELALSDERSAHHARELQVHDAGAGAELRVVQCVADNERTPSLDDLLKNRIAEVRHGVGEIPTLQVACHGHPRFA